MDELTGEWTDRRTNEETDVQPNKETEYQSGVADGREDDRINQCTTNKRRQLNAQTGWHWLYSNIEKEGHVDGLADSRAEEHAHRITKRQTLKGLYASFV